MIWLYFFKRVCVREAELITVRARNPNLNISQKERRDAYGNFRLEDGR